MSRMDTFFYLEDLAKFQRTLDKVGAVPQKVVTKAAGKGRTVVRKAIRGQVPVDTGTLKRGIISTGERSKIKGKKVYQLRFDPALNDVFQRPILNPGEAGGKNPKGYYPASMEYGFLTRSKGGSLSYVPGYHFMRGGAEQSSAAAKSAMLRTATTELEKEWAK